MQTLFYATGSMAKMYNGGVSVEVEIRGPLTQTKYKSLFKFLSGRGKLIKETDQLAIFFHVEKDQFSLKKDHEEEKLVLKLGSWQKGSREEIEVLLKKGNFDNALKLLKGLGFTRGHRVPAYRQDFLYKGVQISLKTKAIIGTHFEMEMSIEDPKDEFVTKKKLMKIAKELKMKVWTDKGYGSHTHKMWQKHHPGPEDL